MFYILVQLGNYSSPSSLLSSQIFEFSRLCHSIHHLPHYLHAHTSNPPQSYPTINFMVFLFLIFYQMHVHTHPNCLNNLPLTAQNVHYLGLFLDRRLTWAVHIRTKRFVLNNRFLHTSQHIVNLNNKLLLCKLLLKPIRAYGIQLRGAATCKNPPYQYNPNVSN